ncbi:TMEM165/GDT1 family protein [Oscillatoria sp. FACHB-1407]|uniref:TMEM165/GDT1 family protein n=1 Tax=Oscillatoria sp. FACHB-1407 TaxID=2692847 RepID=UPI00168953A2|nr:TMEM165/GDT1 family protein [Oscillatoria sp. FACHB-1407]MBD2462402.1 TMEM165/GDT1 family protein [Oscillatoria sp. FACHB-1407]
MTTEVESLESAASTHHKLPSVDVSACQLRSTPEISEQTASQQEANRRTLKGELEIFVSTFITIFLAELGDKTQLTTLLMSAESHSPWVVFAGAGAALVLTSLLGVLLGRWLSTKISPKVLEVSAGVLLLIIAAMLCCDILWS